MDKNIGMAKAHSCSVTQTDGHLGLRSAVANSQIQVPDVWKDYFLEKKMQKLILGIRPHDLNLIKEPGDSQLTGSGKRIRVTGPEGGDPSCRMLILGFQSYFHGGKSGDHHFDAFLVIPDREPMRNDFIHR